MILNNNNNNNNNNINWDHYLTCPPQVKRQICVLLSNYCSRSIPMSCYKIIAAIVKIEAFYFASIATDSQDRTLSKGEENPCPHFSIYFFLGKDLRSRKEKLGKKKSLWEFVKILGIF